MHKKRKYWMAHIKVKHNVTM